MPKKKLLMTKRQFNHASRIIANDCLACGKYIETEEDACDAPEDPMPKDVSKTCAIGALALAAGASRKTLWNFNKTAIDNEGLTGIVKKIQRKFGLRQNEQEEIQELNDNHDTPQLRRRHILKYLRRFFTKDQHKSLTA